MIRFRYNFEDFVDVRYCRVDPISAGIGAMIGGITSLFGGGSKPSAAPTPEAPPAPPPPAGVAPQRQSATSGTPSFIGSSAIPAAAGSNQKTLLGQ